MKRLLLALTLCAACGDPTCEDTVDHAVKLMGKGGIGYGGRVSSDDRARAVKQCKEEKWSGALRNCVVGSRNVLELRDCEKHRKQ